MQMQKRKFRIGDLAKKLNIDNFVIRFWEKEFTLNLDRSTGGQRFYDESDLEKFQQIKTLLYEKKFTIAGAKKQLEDCNKNDNIIASQKTYIQKAQDTNNTSLKASQIAFGSQEETIENSKNFNYTGAKNKPNIKLNAKTLKKMVDLRQNLIKLKELLS